MRLLGAALVLCLVAAVSALAQETRGNISGTVQDAQGVVPGATVKITSVETNASQVLVTNSTGYFEAPLLQPGRYTVAVEMPGFKPMVREGVVLAVGQQVTLGFTLEVGGVNERVTVTAESPVLDTTSVSSGANFDTRLVDSLPMFGNMPVMLARYAPGVNPNANQPNLSQGFVDGPNAAAGTAIGGVGSNTYTIDGATNAGSARRLASSPNADMIQEMRVESSNFDASTGHGLGNQISMMTRAGTNTLRGTANYQHWTNKLNALNEQQKATFTEEAHRIFDLGRSHNSAFTIGGPVYIPRLIDGRGKMFFFGNYSYVNDSIPGRNQGTSTVPDNPKHLQGDFSDMLQLANPNQYLIYDPLTARLAPTPNNPNRVVRDPFPNNIIPRDRIFNPDGSYRNPLMGLYAAVVPPPNQNFLSPTQQPTNNYFRGGEPNGPVSHLFGGRLDYNYSETDRFFFRMSGSTFDEAAFDWTYESPNAQYRGLHDGFRERFTWSYTGNWTRAVGATVIDTQLSTNRYFQQDKYYNLARYKPSSFGLPAYMDQFCESKGGCKIPRVNIAGYQALSVGASDGDTTTNIQGQVNATQVRGAHTLRAGGDVRQADRRRTGGGNSSGAFNFGREYTRQASDESQLTASNLGLSLAAFMLGVPTSVQMEDQTPAYFYNHFFAAYGQDSWRASSNLTINAGLRFEYENGIREEKDRMIVGWDPGATTSITQAAEAAYLASGVPNTPTMLPGISVRGGAVYATDPGQDGTTWKGQAMWMPRVSWAYKLGSRTVVKGGWGLYYDTLNAGDSDPSQSGYNVTTTNNISNDLGRTFLYSMFDPFPVRLDGNRFETPVGASLGYDSVLGTGYTVENQQREHSHQQRWRVSVQRELARNLGVEIAYNGSYSDRIGRNIRQDYLPGEYWNDSNERNTTANSFLTANVTNPFRLQNFAALQASNPALYQRLASNTFFTSATVQRNRLLRAFPHMSNVSYDNLPLGEVKVHALEITVNRRYAHGLTGVGSFSVTRVRENRTVEEYDRAPTIWQGSNGGRPFRVAGSAAYELPFGTGRQFLSQGGPVAAVVGGWQIAGTYDYQPGSLLGDWPNLFFYGNLDDIAIDNPTRERWFNTDAGFEKDPAKIPAGFQKRKFPFRVDGVRGQALSVLSLSLSRSIDLRNRRTVQLRVDAQNVLNRQHWNNANITPTSSNFGQVTTVSGNFMRFITFGIKMNF
jgi:hypothetical protein